MNRFTKQVLIGSMFAFGWATAPTMAQHGDHGDHGHGDHKHGETTSPQSSLPACPVMGEPIDFAQSIETQDGPVFVCCKGCISKYKANPAKYASKVAAQRKALADRPKVQVTCPVMHEPVDPEMFVESNGKKVYLCCKGCKKKYNRDPSKYASALANSYTYQTQCPVMDSDIDPAVFRTAANGMNIYFCCKGCDKKFFKNPHKYAAKLASQGFTINPKEMVDGANDH